MKPKEILLKWVEYFNLYDYERLGELYAEGCINHQTPNGIVKGKENIKNMFKNEFEKKGLNFLNNFKNKKGYLACCSINESLSQYPL